MRSHGHGGLSTPCYHADKVDALVVDALVVDALVVDALVVDALVVYIARVDAICWFEPEQFDGMTSFTIRLAPPKNGQRAGIRLYEDHLW